LCGISEGSAALLEMCGFAGDLGVCCWGLRGCAPLVAVLDGAEALARVFRTARHHEGVASAQVSGWVGGET